MRFWKAAAAAAVALAPAIAAAGLLSSCTHASPGTTEFASTNYMNQDATLRNLVISILRLARHASIARALRQPPAIRHAHSGCSHARPAQRDQDATPGWLRSHDGTFGPLP